MLINNIKNSCLKHNYIHKEKLIRNGSCAEEILVPPSQKKSRPHGNYKEPHLRRKKAAAQGLEFEDSRRGIL